MLNGLSWQRISKLQHLKKARSRAGCEDVIDAWFKKVEEDNMGLNPTDSDMAFRLWNWWNGVLYLFLSNEVHEVGGGSGHEYITVQCSCRSASGGRFPQLILDEGKTCGPAGPLYGVTASGWMDASNFYPGLLNCLCQLSHIRQQQHQLYYSLIVIILTSVYT